MSLKHLNNRQTPTIFGKDLSVDGTTTITGDLNVNGVINGTQSANLTGNNVWTGTNEFAIFRPTCSIVTGGTFTGVNSTTLNGAITDFGICAGGNNFDGENTFLNAVTTDNLTPVNATDATTCKYVSDTWTSLTSGVLSANNTWSGASNNFSVSLPTFPEPVLANQAATKNSTDNAMASLAAGAYTTQTIFGTSNLNLSNSYAVNFQLIGGGGGSTSSSGSVSTSSGVSGSASSQASIIILTASGATIGNPLANFNISTGVGGSGGAASGSAGSGNGTASVLSVTPLVGSGLSTATISILSAAPGNGIQGVSPGQNGTTIGGVWTNAVNTNVVSPYGSSNGQNGGQGQTFTPSQFWGYSSYGFGARGKASANGTAGTKGVIVYTSYLA
jgi:hypothetical protein